MKKLYIVLLLALTISTGYSQNATPNPGFENWTQVGNRFDPDNWNTLNPQTAIIGTLTCTRSTDVHSGMYAIKLTTKSVFGITANGIATTGTLITTPPYGVNGGINYTSRPDSITGWYKYTPAGSDFGFVEFQLLDGNNDSIGYVRFNTPNATVGTYTRFSAPIAYASAATPTHCIWILSASPGTNPTVNSSILVDDLELIFTGVGINSPDKANEISLLQNPAAGEMVFSNIPDNNSRLNVIDVTGKVVLSNSLLTGINRVDVSELNNGVYFYTINGNDGTVKVSGKAVITK